MTCPYEKREIWTQIHAHRGEVHIMTEAEIGATPLEATEHCVASNYQKLGGRKEGSFPRDSPESMVLLAPD